MTERVRTFDELARDARHIYLLLGHLGDSAAFVVSPAEMNVLLDWTGRSDVCPTVIGRFQGLRVVAMGNGFWTEEKDAELRHGWTAGW